MMVGGGREIGGRGFRYRRGEKQTEVVNRVVGGVRERKCKG